MMKFMKEWWERFMWRKNQRDCFLENDLTLIEKGAFLLGNTVSLKGNNNYVMLCLNVSFET